FIPVPVGICNRLLCCAVKLPYRVMTIGDATGSKEDGSVQLLSHIVIAEVPVFLLPVDGMVFIVGFAVEYGFCGHAIKLAGDPFREIYITPGVSRLNHVEVKR